MRTYKAIAKRNIYPATAICEAVNIRAAEAGFSGDRSRVEEELRRGLQRGDLTLWGLHVVVER